MQIIEDGVGDPHSDGEQADGHIFMGTAANKELAAYIHTAPCLMPPATLLFVNFNRGYLSDGTTMELENLTLQGPEVVTAAVVDRFCTEIVAVLKQVAGKKKLLWAGRWFLCKNARPQVRKLLDNIFST
ncbi:hypothetical protein WJX72_004526 [[Myrmecia] bisecta]|uniref:Uncharacterized protein n=1 Tax=[Myrmecia] bisecta TaxID=41462 RepID=A0AAW1QQ99_9CHLO